MFMQPSRDSSIWRSLAIAFGDGLAFSVGMKLTQSALRPGGAAPAPNLTPLAERLDQLERRLAHAETVPVPPPASPAASSFDKKLLEAVVQAVDARLREHAGQVERRLGEIETQVTREIVALRDQDRTVVSAVEARLAELQADFAGKVDAVRAEVTQPRDREREAALERRMAEMETRTASELDALRERDQAIVSAIEAQFLKLQGEFAAQVDAVRQQAEEDRAAIRREIAAAAEAASQSAIREGLAQIRAEAAEKDRELAEMRKQVEESQGALMDLLNGIGVVIRHAAERRGTGPLPVPAAKPDPAPIVLPSGDALLSNDVAHTEGDPQDDGLPGLAQSARSGRLWRVPMVSSMVLAILASGLLMLHY